MRELQLQSEMWMCLGTWEQSSDSFLHFFVQFDVQNDPCAFLCFLLLVRNPYAFVFVFGCEVSSSLWICTVSMCKLHIHNVCVCVCDPLHTMACLCMFHCFSIHTPAYIPPHVWWCRRCECWLCRGGQAETCTAPQQSALLLDNDSGRR